MRRSNAAVRAAAVLVTVAGAACQAGAIEPQRPSAIVDAGAERAAADSGPDSDAFDAGVRPALPSGQYSVTTEVVKDTCGDGVPPAAGTVFVQMKVWHGELTGNFPLPVPPPTPAAGRNYSTLRSDISLFPNPGDSKPLSILGLGSKCLDYETKTHYRVLETTDHEVKVDYVREYGDAAHCPPNRKTPQHCVLDYVYTFSLSKRLCAAECAVSFKRDRDAGAVAECACP